EITILTAFDTMIAERTNRAKSLVTTLPTRPHLPMQTPAPQTQNAPPPPNLGMEICQEPPQPGELPPQEPPPEGQASETVSADSRDLGVSDEVWARLYLDKQAAAAREKEYHDLLASQAERKAEHARRQKEEEEEEERQRHEQQRWEEELRRRRAAAEE